LNRDLPADQRFNLDYGGWYSFYLFKWDDSLDERTFRQHDLRLWSSVSLDQGAHQFYGRLKMQWQDFNRGTGFNDDEDDFVGANLDRGFYQFDLRQALLAYRGERIDWNFKTKVGRDFVDFGTGLALSQPLDQVLLTAEVAKFEIQGLAAQSIRSTNDIDASRPNAGDSERNFWGTQIKYKGFEKHEPFAYFFYNEDQHRDAWYTWRHNFDYDSWYVGLGSTGELLRNLRYSTEWVIEGGRGYIDRLSLLEENRKAAIQAWALDFGLTYLSQRPMHPTLSGEYMFASGDADRVGSPTNVRGGNRRGNDDSFSAFGYRYTGLAFAPRLSNIHIWRVGSSFSPLEAIKGLEKLELGTDWFLFAKNHNRAAVSDFTADDPSGYLGWEMDYFVNWRITSDLSWTARLGSFFPGHAFSQQDTRVFFLTGVTWSF
ncbi:MAG: alginate export family protein, partial [Planctomycetes bacterium]|nr:alginate export family protein [Planctomycetota bacterium]